MGQNYDFYYTAGVQLMGVQLMSASQQSNATLMLQSQ
jgi:hypothetical protein